MATVLVGAALAGFGSAAAGITLGTLTVMQTAAMAAALGGGLAAMSGQEVGGTTIQKVGQVSDKTTPQQAEQLDAAKLGEEESEKRKRKSAKEKFKIDKEELDTTPAESGVALPDDPKKVTGVQI